MPNKNLARRSIVEVRLRRGLRDHNLTAQS
jgi:hypothetical protein